MSFDLAFCVGVVCNVAILALLRYAVALRHNGRFHAAALVAALTCVGLMAHAGFWKGARGSFAMGGSGIRDLLGFLWMWIAFGVTLLPFFLFLVWKYHDEVRRWCLGDRGRAPRSYDQVESALLVRDRDRAERLVRDMIDEDPEDAELHLVLGDVLLRKGEGPAAATAFQAALALSRDAEERAGLRLRMADHLAERGNDPAAAMTHLQAVLDSMPGTSLAQAAVARMARLGKKPA